MVIEDNLLKEKRIEKGLSQKDLAKRFGVGQSYLSMVENGKKEPSRAVLDKYIEVFGQEIAEEIKAREERALSRGRVRRIHNLIDAYDYMSDKSLDAIFDIAKHIIELEVGVVSNDFAILSEGEIHTANQQYGFGMREIYKWLITQPGLSGMPFSRFLVRRARYIHGIETPDTEYEMFTKGTFGGGVMALVAGGDSILARELRKEYPRGGVFNYHEEKHNRNIGPSTDIWSMTCYVTLENNVEIFVRFQSDIKQTEEQQKLLYESTCNFFDAQGIKVMEPTLISIIEEPSHA